MRWKRIGEGVAEVVHAGPDLVAPVGCHTVRAEVRHSRRVHVRGQHPAPRQALRGTHHRSVADAGAAGRRGSVGRHRLAAQSARGGGGGGATWDAMRRWGRGGRCRRRVACRRGGALEGAGRGRRTSWRTGGGTSRGTAVSRGSAGRRRPGGGSRSRKAATMATMATSIITGGCVAALHHRLLCRSVHCQRRGGAQWVH